MRGQAVWTGLFLALFFIVACHKQRNGVEILKKKVILSEPVKVLKPAIQTDSFSMRNSIIILLNKEDERMVIVSTDSLQPKMVSLDSINGGLSEFQYCIKELKTTDPQKCICIKADKDTPYPIFKAMINELQDINITQYKLITEYNYDDDEGTDG